jgi:hypothetical protein
MKNVKINAHVAVISYKRPENVLKIQKILGPCTFYVNFGESEVYLNAGAMAVIECGTNICQARNRAIKDAHSVNLPSIQVSDDLKSLKQVSIYDPISSEENKIVRKVEDVTFEHVCRTMLNELERTRYTYGGVAVTTNRLNYTGEDFSYDKLIVCDLVCIMPGNEGFDEDMALKEDYDMTIRELINTGGVVRCNQFLCDFPHRDNKGGANTYRNTESEQTATDKLYTKWGRLIKKHTTREGQIALNYPFIKAEAKGGKQENLF